MPPETSEMLTAEAQHFLTKLAHEFTSRRDHLLKMRQTRQQAIDAGELPDFLTETAHIRAGEWRVATIPTDLQDRRVEITGPTDRKMVINALNSGARVFMADFEDSNAPTWENLLQGQINLRDAVKRTITYQAENGKYYQLDEHPAVLMVRPRGWHLDEKHFTVDDRPIPGGLFDFGLYFFTTSTLY